MFDLSGTTQRAHQQWMNAHIVPAVASLADSTNSPRSTGLMWSTLVQNLITKNENNAIWMLHLLTDFKNYIFHSVTYWWTTFNSNRVKKTTSDMDGNMVRVKCQATLEKINGGKTLSMLNFKTKCKIIVPKELNRYRSECKKFVTSVEIFTYN